MTTRRKQILEEMGLAPLWRLREPFARRREAQAPPPAPPAAAAAARREPEAPTARGKRQAAEAQPSAAAMPSPAGADARRAAILRLGWDELKKRVAACTDCPLHAQRTQAVFGVGDERAEWLFVGEGPGAEEDARGEPFVGQAGKLLDNMLAAIGLKRGESVYIGNVVKCRPPGNRNPAPAEALACLPYLERQIELIGPRLIVALGRIAAASLLATEASIGSLRGRIHDYRGTPLLVTYHPAYLLRNLADKAKAWEDLCFAARVMRDLQGAPAPPSNSQATKGGST